MTAPGWFHAQGDPEGTVRLWDGAQWVGYPQRDPNWTSPSHPDASIKFVRTPGQVPLQPFAIFAQVGLGLIFLSLLYSIFKMHSGLQRVQDIDASFLDLSAADIATFTDAMTVTAVIGGFAALVGGIAFIAWFWTAYRNLGLWHTTKFAQFWALLGFIIPFLNLVRPVNIMLELVERSPREENRGAISPITAIAWWALWLLPGLFSIAAFGTDPSSASDFFSTIMWLRILSTALNVGSVLCAMVLVHKITQHQDSRLRPTREQLSYVAEQAKRDEFFATHGPTADNAGMVVEGTGGDPPSAAAASIVRRS